MEHKIEEVLCGALLASHLEVTLLETLEIGLAVIGQEVEAKLHRLDFFHDKLDNLQRVALLVDLLDYIRLLHENAVNELHKLVLKGVPFLAQLAVEHTRVVNVELLAREVVLMHVGSAVAIFHFGIGCACFEICRLGLLSLALAKAKYLNEELDQQAFYVSAGHDCMSQLRRILVDLQVGTVGTHDQTHLVIEDDDQRAEPGKLYLL